jgi:ABC-type uncharacterized transport system substrate-binding protein
MRGPREASAVQPSDLLASPSWAMMDRRTFLGGTGAVFLAAPRTTLAQSARKIYRIGILGLPETSDMLGPRPRSPVHYALVRGLQDLGYVYGENFETEPRGAAGKPERFPGLVVELVRLKVDVIVAAGPALPALKQASSTIPIVMGGSADPVGLGYVQSLGHPGGNFTGLSAQGVDVIGKRLELLKELVPSAASVAVLWEPANFSYWQAAEAAARERGWKLLSLKIRDPGEIEGAFRAAADGRASAVLVFASGLLFTRARRVAELAARGRLPAMYEFRQYVEAGGLISYSADLSDLWRRAAVFVDKILKGAKPADLPIEQPTKFELVINLKTARALGLIVPPSLLGRADEVIQ